MGLQLNGQIVAEDILAVTRLDPNRDVYLLVGAVDKIVIKRDIATNPAMQFNALQAARIMKVVSPTVATRNVSFAEIQAVLMWVKEEMRSTKGPADPDLVAFDASMMRAYSPPRPEHMRHHNNSQSGFNNVGWIKTTFYEGLTNLESAAQKARDKGDKSGIRAIAAALSAPGGLEALGEILAMDAFNGNIDRFDMSPNPQGDKGCRRLVNIGNVAVCLQNGVIKPVGMDPFSADSNLGDVTKKGMPGLERPGLPREEWTGYRLKPDQRPWRIKFCEDVAWDLEHMLGPRNRVIRGLATNRLPRDAALRLAAGMDMGTARLKTRLLAMRDQRRAPPRLISAIVALGWAKPSPPPGPPPRR